MNDCWEWKGAKHAHGYGVKRVGGRNGRLLTLHRIAWAWANGPIPPGMHVCHRCDNPPCVNPDHLFLGTNSDNIRDRMAKGRSSRGADRHNAVLDEGKVREIRRRRVAGERVDKLAVEYGIHRNHVYLIHARKMWAWVGG